MTNALKDFLYVPSLYVRVYPSSVTLILIDLRSLTIREGISELNHKPRTLAEFPHYT